jgi:hypothetical protein
MIKTVPQEIVKTVEVERKSHNADFSLVTDPKKEERTVDLKKLESDTDLFYYHANGYKNDHKTNKNKERDYFTNNDLSYLKGLESLSLNFDINIDDYKLIHLKGIKSLKLRFSL